MTNTTRAIGLLATWAMTGCLILPKTVHTPTFVTSEYAQIVPPARAAMSVELASQAGVISVRALAPRVCTRETWDVLDVRHHKTAELEAEVGNDGYGLLLAIVLAPITLSVSGLITGIIVASSDSTTTREREKVASALYECPILGTDLPVVVTLPSGASSELRTDANGQATFDVPLSEAEQGDIAVHVAGVSPRSVRYCRACAAPGAQAHVVPRPPPAAAATVPAERAACLQRRSELMLRAQEETDIKERTRQLTSLPVCPPR